MSDEKDELETGIPIVIDGYGIKLTLRSQPDELDEPAPTSWRDVGKRLVRHLMRIAIAPTALIATTLESATRLISGVSRVPRSLTNLIEEVHSTADEKEKKLQALVDRRKVEKLPTEDELSNSKIDFALSQIEGVLKSLKERGLDAYVVMGPNGQVIVVMGTDQGTEAEVLAALKKARVLLEEPSEYSG